MQQPEVTSVSFYDENLSPLSVTDERNIVYTGMYAYISGKLVEVVVYGDVDGDGSVTTSDTVALRNYIVSGLSSSSPYFKAGDMDFSGSLSISDVTDLRIYISKGLGTIYGVSTTNSGHSHLTSLSNFQSYARNTNYASFVLKQDIDKNTCLASLQSATIFASRSHGGPTGITLATGSMEMEDIKGLPDNALASTRLVYYGACSTASGGSTANNLVNTTYNKGAKTVIGFQDVVYCDATTIWSSQFFKSICNGVSIAQALIEADYTALLATGYAENNQNRLVKGNTTQLLAYPIDASFAQLGYTNNVSAITASDAIASLEKDETAAASITINPEIVSGYLDCSLIEQGTNQTATVTESMRQRIAAASLNDYISTEQYALIYDHYVDDTELYTLRYVRQINGRNTNDSAFVMLTTDGTVVGVGTSNTGVFDGKAVPTVSDASIQNFVDNLIAEEYTSVDTYSIDSATYTLSDSGDVQLSIGVILDYSDYTVLETLIMPL